MKLAFFGSSDFAVPALLSLRDSIALVVTQPDRPQGRKHVLTPTPVKVAALELGLKVEAPERCRAPEFVERVRREQFDALIVAAYGQILPQALLDSARQGGINLHGSLLPRYRGAAPIQRAIMAGDSVTGVTLMQMDKGMDTGNVIAAERISIGPTETAGELIPRMSNVAAKLISAWIDRIVCGDYPRIPQNEVEASYAPKITREDCMIDWSEPAAAAFNRFRGLAPKPGAILHTRYGSLKLHEARLTPGTCYLGVIATLRPLTVGMRSGALVLDIVQPEGKRSMLGTDWAHGLRLSIGDSLRPC